MNVIRTLMVFLFALAANIGIAQQKPNPSKKAKSTNVYKTKAKVDSSRKKTKQNSESILPPAYEINIGRGDTAVIGKTSAAVFYHLDMYRRTRWEPGAPAYDTATGNGFYKSFFKGDYDAAELPSSYSGQKMVILGVEVLMNKNTGKDMNIMYLYCDIPNSIIWVDFDEAMATGEISFIPANSRMSSN
jgi:hypothetical protein